MDDNSITIKEYVDALLTERASHYADLREQDRDSLHAALASNEKRLDGMNEFRQQLKDQQSSYVTRSEIYALVAVAGIVSGLVGAALGHLIGK